MRVTCEMVACCDSELNSETLVCGDCDCLQQGSLSSKQSLYVSLPTASSEMAS
jgi:hypothetical protein